MTRREAGGRGHRANSQDDKTLESFTRQDSEGIERLTFLSSSETVSKVETNFTDELRKAKHNARRVKMNKVSKKHYDNINKRNLQVDVRKDEESGKIIHTFYSNDLTTVAMKKYCPFTETSEYYSAI